MRKHMVLTILILSVGLSLSACNKKAAEPTETTEIIIENGEDPFSLGNKSIDVPTAMHEFQTTKELEIQETYEDGSYTALLDNGDTLITMNGTDLNQYSKLSEKEAVNLDIIIGSWIIDSTLPEEYLTREINRSSFPSLSNKERTELINEIKSEKVHDPANIKELETQRTEQEPVLETKDYSNLSGEEMNKLIEKNLGVSVDNGGAIEIEAIRDLPLGGAQ